MYKILKKLIPLEFKKYLTRYIGAKNIALPQDSRSFVFLAADYGNIGDLAITSAQVSFLRRYAPTQHVVRIPISKTRTLLRSVQSQVRADDLITIIGGGNMGGTYSDIEELRQLVIKSFPNNRIVCFPQTLDWDDTAESKKALQNIVKTYSQHSDIHVFARESITHSKLNELFNRYDNVSIGLVPDIVMSATASALGTSECLEPSGILRCLRDDKEVALSYEQYIIIDKALANTGYQIEQTDTHAGGSQLDEAHCTKLLADKLSQFRAAKLVVTDRLHGMILCLLSGTPCLVLPNSNHKISQTYSDWLYNHPRLVFLELKDINEIPKFIDKLLAMPHGVMNDSLVDINKYNDLKKALTNI